MFVIIKKAHSNAYKGDMEMRKEDPLREEG
jgi:hypothetical protein